MAVPKFAPVKTAPGPTRYPLTSIQPVGSLDGTPVMPPVTIPAKFALVRLERSTPVRFALLKFVPGPMR